MSCYRMRKDSAKDRRRYGVVAAVKDGRGSTDIFVGGQLWATVRWTPASAAWRVQDAAGHGLTHSEDTEREQERDPETAIRLAKRMIVDGRMPTPEEAVRQAHMRQGHDHRHDHHHLGEPIEGDLIKPRHEPIER